MKNKNLILTTLQQEVIIGTLLGDCHLEKNKGAINYRLKFQQSEFHKNYVFHLYNIFNNLVSTPPKSRIRTGFGKEQTTWYFNSIAHPVISYYGELFYKDKTHKKIGSFLKIYIIY
jgi:hypothetical protein